MEGLQMSCNYLQGLSRSYQLLDFVGIVGRLKDNEAMKEK